jgi:hypothetical protein
MAKQNNKECPITKLSATANDRDLFGLEPGRHVVGRHLAIGHSLLFCLPAVGRLNIESSDSNAFTLKKP